jgi:hypothetical protein
MDIERGDAKCVDVAADEPLMPLALELDASTIHIVDLQSWQRRNSITFLPDAVHHSRALRERQIPDLSGCFG